MPLNIAIDGPVGAGKSSIADAVARRLNILHLDTGAMYRAVGLSCLRAGISLEDEQAVTRRCGEVEIGVRHEQDGQHTLLDGEDVSREIRTEQAGLAASAVSRFSGVRKAMVALQQKLAAAQDMLVDGRDICTVVLPKAPVKIYLTASAEERARRRWEQLKEKGGIDSFEQVLEDLKRRDDQDMHRATDPLRIAEDATVVDTTGSTFEESVERILTLVKERYHE